MKAATKPRVIEPSKERRRQTPGSIERAEKQIADANGDEGHPWQAVGLLDQLERRGAIDSRQRQAGEEFNRLFHLAALEPLRAANMDSDLTRLSKSFGGVEFHRGSEAAYRKVSAALDALDGLHSPGGSCAYCVLGLGMSRREWAGRQRWRGQDPNSATGTLICVLSVLARHFGY
jgi:hypothetical protein